MSLFSDYIDSIPYDAKYFRRKVLERISHGYRGDWGYSLLKHELKKRKKRINRDTRIYRYNRLMQAMRQLEQDRG